MWAFPRVELNGTIIVFFSAAVIFFWCLINLKGVTIIYSDMMGYTIGYTNTKCDTWVCLKMGNGPPKVWSFQQACPSSKHNRFWCNVRLMLHEMRHDPQWHINPTESNFFKMRNLNKNYQTKNPTKVLQRRNSSTKVLPKVFTMLMSLCQVTGRASDQFQAWRMGDLKS